MFLPFFLLGFVLFFIVYLVSVYNSLISLRNKVAEAWSGIDVQLKRRSSLIPNLLEAVKGYATHEKDVFEKVTQARSALMNAQSPQQAAEANNMLTGALKSLFAVAEAYPELKASDNFKQFQSELNETEDKIAYSRQFYNANALDLNTRIELFPSNLVANMFSFKKTDFFRASEEEKQDVKVSF